MEGSVLFWGYKEQESNLILPEHDDDDDVCIVCFVPFSVLFVCICVLNYCHRVATQLQLNISYQIISILKPPRCTISQIYFGTTFYTFRTVSLSIIRSLRLYIQRQVYVIQVLWLFAGRNKMVLQFHHVPASKQPQDLYDIYLMLYVQS